MHTDLPPLRAIIYGSGARFIVPSLPVSRLVILFAVHGCLCILIVLRAYCVDPHHFLHFCARVAGTIVCFFCLRHRLLVVSYLHIDFVHEQI
jgi:hypothetical protein